MLVFNDICNFVIFYTFFTITSPFLLLHPKTHVQRKHRSNIDEHCRHQVSWR
jgi:hypothetical protein